ncbi:SipW-dependent-type signal peptide-containing protein [Brevibacterium linens]|uniref:SipW-dependent-type signal peptide-containing protein n=1 Tax=Brevibacterium linens TaxID=1703 RepID=UPI0013792E75|nr:SipW-dependent-type signal peptide-containing protein [Brevibacterium linens]
MAVVALLALVAGPSAVNGTLASWSDSEASQGEFQAGSLNISDLKCSDNSVLLNLLGSELKLDWQPPPQVGEMKITYKVTVVKRRLLTSTTYEFTTTDTSITFKDPSLLNISTYEMTVQAMPVGNWTGNSMTANGHGVTIVLGLALRCN